MAQPTITRAANNNLTIVSLGDKTVYFSYETVVAFYTPKSGQVVSENIWSNTTGRHLANIDGGGKAAKLTRKPHAEFKKLLDRYVK